MVGAICEELQQGKEEGEEEEAGEDEEAAVEHPEQVLHFERLLHQSLPSQEDLGQGGENGGGWGEEDLEGSHLLTSIEEMNVD